MLSPGDGIAAASVCAVIIAAVIKLAPKRDFDIGFIDKLFVRKDLFDARIDALVVEIKRIAHQIDELNKFLRNRKE